ncbi:MAG: DUF6870 family protein [Dysgonomonas sp.]
MTADEYKKLLEVDFNDTKLEDMPDLAKLQIDSLLPQEQRQIQYLNKVKNPYMVRIGNMKIKVRFANNGISIDDAFKNLLLNV